MNRNQIKIRIENLSKSLGQKLNGIFFPYFSEIELITLFYLITLFFIEQRFYILDFSTRFLLEDFMFGIFLIIIVFVFYIELGIIALKSKTISTQDRINFSFLFYTSILIISFFSSYELIDKSFFSTNWYNNIESIFILFILLRSFFALFIIIFAQKMGIHYFYSKKMTNEQINKKELILLIVLSTIIYLLLRNNHTISSTLILSYFYVTTTILFFRKILRDKIVIN